MLESQIQMHGSRGFDRRPTSRKESADSMDMEWPLDVKGVEYHLEEVDDDEEEDEMEDDRDWCADSLAVELSSVESAAMSGFMGMLHGASSSESIATAVNNSSSSKSVKIVPIRNSTHKLSRATSGGSAEDSDNFSTLSHGSTSRGQDTSMRGHTRSSGSTGDASVTFPMAPPSSPNVLNQLSGFHLTSTPFTTPAVRRDSSAHSHGSGHSWAPEKTTTPIAAHSDLHSPILQPHHLYSPHQPAVETQLPASPLLISIPEADWWRTEQDGRAPAHTRAPSLGSGLYTDSGHHVLGLCEYSVEEVDSDVDSTATVQSLAVEVESLDEEGTYMSYGGDCEDQDLDALEYSIHSVHSGEHTEHSAHSAHSVHSGDHFDSHSLHSSGHLYLGSDAENEEVRSEYSHPVGYSYGQGSGGSGERRTGHRRGFSVGSADAVEAQPSPPPLRHPVVRKSFSDLQNRGDEEYGMQTPEFVRSFSTDTPSNAAFHVTSRGAAQQSTAAHPYLYPVNQSASPTAMLYNAGQNQYYSEIYNTHATYYPNAGTTHNHSHANTNHGKHNIHTNSTHHKHHRHTAKTRPTHPEPFLSSTYVYNNHNNPLQVHSNSGGAGKRKRSDSEESPRIRNSVFGSGNSNGVGSGVANDTSGSGSGGGAGLFSDSKKPFQYNTTNTYRSGHMSGSSTSSTINVYSGFTLPVYNAHYSDATDTDSMVEGEGGYDAASEKG